MWMYPKPAVRQHCGGALKPLRRQRGHVPDFMSRGLVWAMLSKSRFAHFAGRHTSERSYFPEGLCNPVSADRASIAIPLPSGFTAYDAPVRNLPLSDYGARCGYIFASRISFVISF